MVITIIATEECLAEIRAQGEVLPPFCSQSRLKLAGGPVFPEGGGFLGVFGAAWNATPNTVEDETRETPAALHEAAEPMASEPGV